jgi:hypothetical protein
MSRGASAEYNRTEKLPQLHWTPENGVSFPVAARLWGRRGDQAVRDRLLRMAARGAALGVALAWALGVGLSIRRRFVVQNWAE